MKVTILTYGSRGDVQPFLPLSLGLMAKGHSVKLVAPSRFKNLVETHGIHFVPLAGDPEDLSRNLNDAGYNFIKMVRVIMSHAIEIGADILRQTEKTCSDADLIIHTFTHAVGAHTIAREKNIPDIHIQTFPMFTPTGDYPNIALPDLKLRTLNRFTHLASQKIALWTSRSGYEQVRRRVGLPKRKPFSPFDAVPHDWLLLRCKMIIYHGGAGTTSAGLRAGVPNIIVPFTADQPFWGNRVHAIGAGPTPILVRKLSGKKLTRAIAKAEEKMFVNVRRLLVEESEAKMG